MSGEKVKHCYPSPLSAHPSCYSWVSLSKAGFASSGAEGDDLVPLTDEVQHQDGHVVQGRGAEQKDHLRLVQPSGGWRVGQTGWNINH